MHELIGERKKYVCLVNSKYISIEQEKRLGKFLGKDYIVLAVDDCGKTIDFIEIVKQERRNNED
jgi:hypothetical protein